MSKHKKHHDRSHHTRKHSRREQFVTAPPRRGRISPTVLMPAASVVLFGVLVYVIGSRQAGSPAVGTGIAGTGGDVRFPVATFADGAARFYRYATPPARFTGIAQLLKHGR